MPQTIFVRSSRRYSSYTDFWRLVELSGFPIVESSQVHFDEDILYIWAELDVEFMVLVNDQPKERRRARTAFWHIEPVDRRASDRKDAAAWWKASLDQTLKLVDVVWVSDMGILAMDPRATWVCFGGHKGLREKASGSGPAYDVAHLGQRTPRREKVISELERRDITVSPSPWGAERIQILSSSKLMLDVQRLEGIPLVTPIRWVTAAAYELPLVREELPDPLPLVAGESILMAPIDKLADRVEEALGMDLLPIGRAAWKIFCQTHTFRNSVELAHASLARSTPTG